jgi:hypothetical protein
MPKEVIKELQISKLRNDIEKTNGDVQPTQKEHAPINNVCKDNNGNNYNQSLLNNTPYLDNNIKSEEIGDNNLFIPINNSNKFINMTSNNGQNIYNNYYYNHPNTYPHGNSYFEQYLSINH